MSRFYTDLSLSVYPFYLETIHKKPFLVFRREYFDFPRRGLNKIALTGVFFFCVQSKSRIFTLKSKMNTAEYQIFSYECKKIFRLNVKTINVNFIIRFHRFLALIIYRISTSRFLNHRRSKFWKILMTISTVKVQKKFPGQKTFQMNIRIHLEFEYQMLNYILFCILGMCKIFIHVRSKPTIIPQ